MRYSVLALIFFVAAIGCANDGQTAAAGSVAPPNTSDSRGVAANSGTSIANPSVTSAESSATTGDASTQKHTGPDPNMHRIYQLHDLGRTKVKVGATTLDLWIMDSEPKRAEGMMWLEDKDVKDNEGMIFVFSDAKPQSFWMQNTVLPLDIIYITDSKKVLNIVQGKPFDESSLPSSGPAMYVIELKKGMAKKFGIKPGMKLAIADSIRSKD